MNDYSKIQLVLYIIFFHQLPPFSMVGQYINVHFTPSSLSLFSFAIFKKIHNTARYEKFAAICISRRVVSYDVTVLPRKYNILRLLSLCQNWKERIYLLHWNWQSLSIGCRCLWTRLAYKCIVARDEKVSKR